MKANYSIVLPCFNESETIQELFSGYEKTVTALPELEVIFVNNGSTDNSSSIFWDETSKPNREWAKVITIEKNIGYGHGIIQGLKHCSGEFIGWTHADSQYSPEIIVEGFNQLTSAKNPHKTIVQGKRYGRPWLDVFFTAGMSIYTKLLLHESLIDINAQPKMFHRSFLSELDNAPNDFSLDLYFLYQANSRKLETVRYPVHFGKRIHGIAKGGGGGLPLKYKLSKRTFSFINRLRKELKNQ